MLSEQFRERAHCRAGCNNIVHDCHAIAIEAPIEREHLLYIAFTLVSWKFFLVDVLFVPATSTRVYFNAAGITDDLRYYRRLIKASQLKPVFMQGNGK